MTVTDRALSEALRLLRVPEGTAKPDGSLLEAVRAAFAEVEETARPKSVWARFPVSVEGETVQLAGELEILSRDLARLLSHSHECYLMAVTLGPEVDRRVLQAQRRGMMEGLVLDVCASVCADTLCDEVEAGLDLHPGERLTMRFSPGYGDAPLSASEDIIALLNATRRIGLSMTRSFMMTPLKSVTAVLGVLQEGTEAGAPGWSCGDCAGCGRQACPYRR